jgi:myo-inositol-1(or 4)-monophosphatase
MDLALDFAIQLAHQAGQFLVTQYRTPGSVASLKSDHSVVTIADLAADQLIRDAIQAAYPDDLYLSEELQPALGESPGEKMPALWIVDPLDGTTNFSLGLPIWGILLTRLVGGWPDLAAMYFPMLDEMYTTQRGQGAYLNGEKVEVKQNNQLTSFFACCSRTFRLYQVDIPFKPRILGSAAYNLCCVARSSAVISFEASPKIWDIAGAWLLLQEAGGWIETYDGSQPFPVIPPLEYARLDFPVIAGATPELVRRWQREIKPRS